MRAGTGPDAARWRWLVALASALLLAAMAFGAACATSQGAVDPSGFPAPAGAGEPVALNVSVPEPPPMQVEVPGPTVEVPGPTVTETITIAIPPDIPPPAATPVLACDLPGRPNVLSLPATGAQLRVNQRVAVAAVRRLNAIRARLDGRPEPAAPAGKAGRIRVTTTQLRINQRISEAGFRRARAIYRERGGTGAPALTSLAGTIRFTRAGVGANQLTNIRALDMLNCINRNLG